MKNLPVVALPEIEADVRAAIAHYASWRSDGAEHVRQKYDETAGWIGWNPESFPKKRGAVRRALLKQSYYVVYFIAEHDRVVVLAVLDGRRDPREVRALLKKRKGGERI